MRRRIRHLLVLCVIMMALSAGSGLVDAQGDPTITPENANLLSEQATIDLGATTTYSPVWSAQSDLIAVPIGAGGTQLIDMATLSVSGNLPVITEGAAAVSAAINPGGSAIVTGEITPDGTISRLQVWDVAGQSPLTGGEIGGFTHLRFLQDEQLFAGGTQGARFVEVSGGATGEILPLMQLIRPVISPDGTRLVVYQPNGPQILDIQTGSVMGQAITPVSPADSVFSDDGLLLTVAIDARFSTTAEVAPLQIFDAFSGVLLRTMQGEFSTILAPTFSPDGRLLAAATCANYDATDENCLTPEIWLWDTTSGQKVGGFIFASNTTITGLSFSPDGQWLAAVFNGALHLYGLFAPVISTTPTPTPETITSDAGQAIAPTPGTYRLDSTATACDGYGVADGVQVSTTHSVTVTQLPPDSLEVKISGTMAGAPLFLLGGVAGRGSGTFQAYLFLGGGTTANFSEVTLELVSAEMMRGTFQSADCLLEFTLTLEQADPNAAATPSINLGVTGCQVISESPVNKRASPSTDAEKVGELGGRDVGRVTGQTTGADGQIWYQLTDGSWVRSDVVDDNGLCADVPFVNP
ncbi:MAG: hypothetical protein K8L91_02745 [Anaerolineae bacterium]|nr:hypothetical protein [Anaerolineae bacterium]